MNRVTQDDQLSLWGGHTPPRYVVIGGYDPYPDCAQCGGRPMAVTPGAGVLSGRRCLNCYPLTAAEQIEHARELAGAHRRVAEVDAEIRRRRVRAATFDPPAPEAEDTATWPTGEVPF